MESFTKPAGIGLRGTKPAGLKNVFFLGLLVWLLIASAYHGAVSPTAGITGVDFRLFYEAAGRLNKGLPLYQTGHDLYVYSPLFALLLRPLALLPYEKALHLWFFMGAGCLVLSVLMYARAARLAVRDAASLGLMLLVGFRFWPTTMNFGLGQANFVLLALLAGMYWADSVRKPMMIAALIVAGALVKVWMIGLVLHLLLNRQWKAAGLSVAGFAAALLLLFSLIGWQEWPLFLRAGAASAKQIADHRVRQSVLGFADLHFHANPLIQPLVSSRVWYGLFVVACVAAIGWGLILVWRAAPGRSLYQDRMRFGLVIVSVLLLLPTFEDEYIVLCLPLLWTLLLGSGSEKNTFEKNTFEKNNFEKNSFEENGSETNDRLLWLLPGGILAYLALNRSWPVYLPIAPVYQHGLRSLLVSVDFFAVAGLWLMAFFVFYRRSGLNAPQVAKGSNAAAPPAIVTSG